MITVINESGCTVIVILEFKKRTAIYPGEESQFILLERRRPDAAFLSRHGIANTPMFSPGTVQILDEKTVRSISETDPNEYEDFEFGDSAKRSDIRKTDQLTVYVE
ncbi:hypothetical protein H4R99_004966, partial [Coemansia sp. RSA 1722]